MKAFFALFLACPTIAFCQLNLVPNFSFEDSVICPTPNFGPLPKPWYVPSNIGRTHGFYYNGCSNYLTSQVPSNRVYGYPNFQYAKTGIGYGVCDYLVVSRAFPPNARSYLQIRLKDSLQAGKCYYCGYWVSLPNPNKRATNNVSMLLTKKATYSDTIANPYGTGLITGNPQVVNYGNPVVVDTMNWVKVGTVVVATGGEQFITTGNFKSDSLTTMKMLSTTGPESAAYLIDNVFVIPLDSMPLKADAGLDTTVALGDSTFIGSLTNGIPNITWYDMAGNVIDTGRPGFFVHPTATTSYIIEQTVCGYYSRDTVTVTVNLLPLHWLSVEAFPLSTPWKGAGVRWQTANEQNVSHFNIQRSYRGTNEFENIGTISANNKPYNEYSYVDVLTSNQKRETALYRLQSIDKDGQRSYSPIKRVTFSTQQPLLSIYPNPVTNTINIAAADCINIAIFNEAGMKIINKSVVGLVTTVDLSSQASGLYLIKCMDKTGKILSKKFIKVSK